MHVHTHFLSRLHCACAFANQAAKPLTTTLLRANSEPGLPPAKTRDSPAQTRRDRPDPYSLASTLAPGRTAKSRIWAHITSNPLTSQKNGSTINPKDTGGVSSPTGPSPPTGVPVHDFPQRSASRNPTRRGCPSARRPPATRHPGTHRQARARQQATLRPGTEDEGQAHGRKYDRDHGWSTRARRHPHPGTRHHRKMAPTGRRR